MPRSTWFPWGVISTLVIHSLDPFVDMRVLKWYKFTYLSQIEFQLLSNGAVHFQ